MEEWKEYKLGEVCKSIADGDHMPPPKVNAGIPFVTISNITDCRLDFSNTYYVPQEYYDSLDVKRKPQQGDTIYSVVGTFGKPVYIKDNKPFVFQRHIAILRPDESKIVPQYLFYTLLSPQFYRKADVMAIGAVQRTISLTSLRNATIKVPPVDVQKRIVDTLKSLDDKIEVNRRINDNFVVEAFFQILLIWILTTPINDNLEQQAQALFKSWFVDFEPFKNGEFVESEMGMIPKGCRVGRYEDIIEETISGDWGKEKPEGNYIHKVACIRGCDFQDIKNGLRGNTPERYILERNYQKKHFQHNDVLVEISGGTQTVSTGRACPVSQMLIDKFNEDIVCTNFCRIVRPIKEYAAYLYYSWLYKYNNKVMFGFENGTSGIKNFRIKDFISIEPVVIPPIDLLEKFQHFIDSVQLQIQTRGSESSRLAQLRDTLLPRLMSSELSVDGLKGQQAVSPGQRPGSTEHVSSKIAL